MLTQSSDMVARTARLRISRGLSGDRDGGAAGRNTGSIANHVNQVDSRRIVSPRRMRLFDALSDSRHDAEQPGQAIFERHRAHVRLAELLSQTDIQPVADLLPDRH